MSEIKILITENITPEIRQFFPYLPAVYADDIMFTDQKMILRSLGVNSDFSDYPRILVCLLHSNNVESMISLSKNFGIKIEFDYIVHTKICSLKTCCKNALMVFNSQLGIYIAPECLPFNMEMERLKANFIRSRELKNSQIQLLNKAKNIDTEISSYEARIGRSVVEIQHYKAKVVTLTTQVQNLEATIAELTAKEAKKPQPITANPTAKLAVKLELRDKLRAQYNEMCSKVDQEIEELTQQIEQFS